MNILSIAFSVFIFALIILALDYWDISQGGKGFEGLVKAIGCLFKWLAIFTIALVVLAMVAVFSASGFLFGFFSFFNPEKSGFVCFSLSVFVLIFVLFKYLSRKTV